MKIDPRTEKFVQLYFQSGNACQSYKDAGYKAKGKSAEVNSSRKLGNAMVQTRLQELKDKAAKDFEVTRDELIADLRLIKEANKKEIDYHPTAIKAIERLSKMLGFEAPVLNKNLNGNLNVETKLNEEQEKSVADAFDELTGSTAGF